MTKAEAMVWNSDRWHCDRRVLGFRHDGTVYHINVYLAKVEGSYYELRCDSYFGDSLLTKNGENERNIEMDYDTALKGLV